MSLLLDVPYWEKDEAKKLGAIWNPVLKKWYVEDYMKYPLLEKWIPNTMQIDNIIICDHIYVIEGKTICSECKKETRVIAYGIEKFCNLNEGLCGCYVNTLCLVSSIYPLPYKIYKYIKNNFSIKPGIKYPLYKTNICDFCSSHIGSFFEAVWKGNKTFPLYGDVILWKFPFKYDFVAHEIPPEHLIDLVNNYYINIVDIIEVKL